jgi:hypothetical protein
MNEIKDIRSAHMGIPVISAFPAFDSQVIGNLFGLNCLVIPYRVLEAT